MHFPASRNHRASSVPDISCEETHEWDGERFTVEEIDHGIHTGGTNNTK
jgi:hypothetical protein